MVWPCWIRTQNVIHSRYYRFRPTRTGGQWIYTREGREDEYHGLAVQPRHLSMYETYILQKHKHYNPDLDAKQKYAGLEELYLALKQSDRHDEGSSELSAELKERFDKRHGGNGITIDSPRNIDENATKGVVDV